MLIADDQLYPQFPVDAYMVYRFLQNKATYLSHSENNFFLNYVDKYNHLIFHENLNITGIID